MTSGTLAGRTVLVPRAAGQAGSLSGLLRSRGAEPLELPVIEIAPPADPRELAAAVEALLMGRRFDWLVLTSANAVAAVRATVEATGGDSGGLAATRVAAVGPATAAALRRWGVTPDCMPPESTGAALAAALPPPGSGTARVLLPRSDLADDRLPGALRAAGYTPVEVIAYRTVGIDAVPPELQRRMAAGEVDWLACTSPSTLAGTLRLLGGRLPATMRLAVIGPTTAAAARAAGLKIDAQAERHTAAGLVEAIERAAVRPPTRTRRPSHA